MPKKANRHFLKTAMTKNRSSSLRQQRKFLSFNRTILPILNRRPICRNYKELLYQMVKASRKM